MASAERGGVVRGKVRRMLTLVVLGIVAAYGVYLGILYTAQDAVVFPVSYANSGRGGPVPEEVEVVHVETEPGVKVEGWLLVGEGRSAEDPGPAVLYAHGNAELIDHNLHLAEFYAEHGFTVLLGEYRGYGRSGGRPSERGIARDFLAFYDLLASRPEVDPKRVVLHGRSLGGAVAVGVAAERDAAALVLDATFRSAASMAARFGAPSFLLKHPFRSDRVLPGLEMPVLVSHGERDQIIPVRHARAIERLGRDVRLELYPRSGHNDLPDDWSRYSEVLMDFLAPVRDGAVTGGHAPVEGG